MNNRLVGASGFVLVLLGLIAMVCVFVFQDGIQTLNWIDAEAAARGSMILCFVGAVLGWVSFKTSTGKVAGILGSLIVAFYVMLLMQGTEPSPGPLPERLAVPHRPVTTEQGAESDAVNRAP